MILQLSPVPLLSSFHSPFGLNRLLTQPGAYTPVLDSGVAMPESEKAFWHRQYRFEPYFVVGRSFDQYSPAYQLGWNTAQIRQAQNADFDLIEPELNQQWLAQHGSSLLDWNQVKLAVKAAWERAIGPHLQDLLSQTAGKKLALTREAGRQFRECCGNYLSTGHGGMHSEALQRFAQVSQKLLNELEALPVNPTRQPQTAKGALLVLERTRQAWRDSALFAPAVSIQDVLAKLQKWLSAAEALYQEILPAQVQKLVRHHMLVLRGQLQSVQWLSTGQA